MSLLCRFCLDVLAQHGRRKAGGAAGADIPRRPMRNMLPSSSSSSSTSFRGRGRVAEQQPNNNNRINEIPSGEAGGRRRKGGGADFLRKMATVDRAKHKLAPGA